MSIRHSLLALLDPGPRFGLQLKQQFEARTGAVWPLNVGQVYTTLQRLERDGLVEAEVPGGAAQRLYRISEPGRAELRAWLASPPASDPPGREELVIKVVLALSVDGVEVRDVIQAHRRPLVEALQGLTRLKSTAGTDELGWLLVVDSLIFKTEAQLRWLDVCEARLAAGGPRPAPSAGTDSAPADRAQELAR